jgi:biopolymer transport protein ExbD
MAGYSPSKRRHHKHDEVELPLIPAMSLMVVLVPMLIQTAAFVKLSSVQLNLPSTDVVTYVDQPVAEQMAQESISVALTRQGFQIISEDSTLRKIPLSGSLFDYETLKSTLSDLKRGKFSGQTAIILLVDDGVIYDDIIHTMDVCRPYFPGVSLADRVQTGG